VLPGVFVAEVELTVFPLLDDVRDVKCGLVGNFGISWSGPSVRSWLWATES
jgi:hypothetical protein